MHLSEIKLSVIGLGYVGLQLAELHDLATFL
jgi:UDP-N-acetyl-D-mannosaminuronate dehydrogenase